MPKPNKRLETLRGRVLALNFSPKGDIEGLLLGTDEGMAQVNLPKDSAPSEDCTIGATVSLRVDAEDQHGEHPVYRLADQRTVVSGVVARLNYARHGEVNGFVLENGPFVHLKPDGARKHDVRVDEHVTVSGVRRQGSAIAVIDASTLTRDRKKSA